ncbi:MAG: N-6 DNA methylase [bacterium]|nr:N-6 DNA methylase [bacterium]
MEYLSVQDVSNIWNISKRRIQVLCREGRISGAKMIGNMWVVPEDTERPVDGRTKNPVKEEQKVFSAVRRDLKKLLKVLYKKCDEIGLSEESKKAYVLTILAGTLCKQYLHDSEDRYTIYKRIYKDIKGEEEKFILDNAIVSLVEEYLYSYADNSEIDNIVSWAYQYLNKIIAPNDYSQTQFFTEKYMIQYLVDNIGDIANARKILDPCSGGGNFLVECYESLCGDSAIVNIEEYVIEKAKQLYGYDIDKEITKIAVVNIRIRAISILNRRKCKVSFDIWDKITPNIFCSFEKDRVKGSLAKDNRLVKNIITGELVKQNIALGNAEMILTNPPFATIKGMLDEQKRFLKANYPLSNCDTCVSFFEAIYEMLAPNGKCGIVSQNAWMHLKTFSKIRAKLVSEYIFHNIANLGSGAFYDLSGEKSNVSLLIFEKRINGKILNNKIRVLNLTTESLSDKINILEGNHKEYIMISQNDIDGINGFDFAKKSARKKIEESKELYKEVAVPMQGTSTGNAKELVAYFWEHFNEKEWILVSNGGGYCRWEGLNDSVVKWGNDGEYIKAQKGSALRNAKYFNMTQMVFSDTGTAGLNVRVLLKNQIFIASGPGIRVINGSEYAHLAFLNSRLAANYVRTISPKLTIAAGYIGQIPIRESIYTSVILERNAKLCVDLKKSFLQYRPNNVEYSAESLEKLNGTVEKQAWEIFRSDLTNELLKLEIENQCDEYILAEYDLTKEEKTQLDVQVGTCAYKIKGSQDIDLRKLDQYIDKLTDMACMLKRTRASKNSLGSDGILEFISKDLHVSPELIVKRVTENPFIMEKTLSKYGDLLLHNTILRLFNYNVNTGVLRDRVKIEEAVDELNKRFGLSIDSENWIIEKFIKIHTGIFKGIPFLLIKDGEIQKYDK